ncbi:PE-PGRS family protein [Haloferula helveola]|uniref:FAD:protein FMN transferase n=1 Tax=Haloferula helveola TaxID=490095 RepID=A0ABM7RD77_9BACT|nr:PE-PGRS family protein [Haloferula helveola]
MRTLSRLLPIVLLTAFSPADEPVRFQDPALGEASGLAVSPTSPGFLWLVNDSGSPANLHLASNNGAARGTLKLEGVRNIDWEDLASFTWNGRAWLLVADVGDNQGQRETVMLHLVAEPKLPPAGDQLEATAAPEWTLRFRYEDGPRDCESVSVDPAGEAIYLLSKRDPTPRLYRLPLRKPEDGMIATAEFVTEAVSPPRPKGALPHPFGGQPTAMDFSSDGEMAAILTYQAAYLLRRGSAESWADVFRRKPVVLGTHGLPQAEALAFTPDGHQLLVTSEGVGSKLVTLEVPSSDEVRHDFSRELMGTRFSITCYSAYPALAEAAANAAFAEAEAINAVASDYIPDSELMRISTAPVGKAVELSPSLYDLLSTARRIAEDTDGCYDPTLGPLTTLWRETRNTGKLPDAATLDAARKSSGWKNFTLDPELRTITLGVPGMRFDLGGIAKGYAADAMLRTMEKYGVARTSVVAGGDVALGEPPPGRDAWNVGLKTFDKLKPDEVIGLSGSAVSTSGDLHQFVEIDGVRYSHILDPKTGLGLTRPIAVSVIAPSATLTDPLATAACVAGADKAESLVRKSGATDVRIRTQPE